LFSIPITEAEMSKLKELVLLLVITFLSTHNVMAENVNMHDFPFFQNGILTVPRVDTLEQSGNFQGAEFQFTDQGTWELLDFNTFPLGEGIEIEFVEAIVTDSFPVQVFLQIRANVETGCDYGQINQRLVANQLEVTVFPDSLLPKSEILCAAVVFEPERIIPLSVFGLSAGTYEYSVNGGDIGTFTLAEDNRFIIDGTSSLSGLAVELLE